jgi:6-pyruvoyl-tetrahydropterin synthase
MTQKFPTIRKECSFAIRARHDLTGITNHPDAMDGLHGHRWTVTLIWIAEYNCKLGFQRDEWSVEQSWGKRLEELEGVNLSERMKLPATAENFAAWLLFFWLCRPSEREVNFELSGVRVTKDGHSAEIMHSATNKRAWEWFGGEVA